MVNKYINNQAPEYIKCMLLRKGTDSDKRSRQEHDRISLRRPHESTTHEKGYPL